MNRFKATLLATALVLAAGAATATTASDETPAERGCTPDVTFENEDVRVWFQGLKGHLKVFEKDNETGSVDGVYTYVTDAVTELDADGESVAWFNLERAYPMTSGCTIEESEEWVNMTLTVTDDVYAVDGDGASVGDATVTFVYHFNKTSHGAKFDLFVEDWPWQTEDGELSFDFSVDSSYTIEEAENGLGFRDDDGNARGYVEWAPNATAYYEDGHNETAVVDSETTLSEDAHHAETTLRFTNVTAGYVELEYDPWVGVGTYLIVGGLLLVGLAPVEQALPDAIYRIVTTLA